MAAAGISLRWGPAVDTGIHPWQCDRRGVARIRGSVVLNRGTWRVIAVGIRPAKANRRTDGYREQRVIRLLNCRLSETSPLFLTLQLSRIRECFA